MFSVAATEISLLVAEFSSEPCSVARTGIHAEYARDQESTRSLGMINKLADVNENFNAN